MLQVDPAYNDELETICEGCYEIENTFIFAWFSIPVLDTIVDYIVQFIDFFLIAMRIT
jgi:hypothetical protein